MDRTKETLPNPKPTVDIIYAGGTISSLATTEGYREGGHVVDLVEELSSRMPGFDELFTLGSKEVAYTGLSENIDYDDWDEIDNKVIDALERNATGILITHGTDSMEQTAQWLDHSLGKALIQKGAKVILTGANDDVSVPNTDVWDNLKFGLECAHGDAPPGVYVAFNGKLIPASRVVKKPFDPDTDTSMTYVANDGSEYALSLQKQKARDDRIISAMEAAFDKKQSSDGIVEYAVNVVRPNHGEFLEFIASLDVRAVLLTLYHSGTANTENPDMSVSVLVERLRKDKGIVFFGATENGEPASLDAYETSIKLRQAGVVPLYDMPHEVAAAKLRLINSKLTSDKLIQEMLTTKAGEIDESRIVSKDINQLLTLYS